MNDPPRTQHSRFNGLQMVADTGPSDAVTIIIPLLDDWKVASLLLRQIEPHAPPGARVLLIDDGSMEPVAREDFRFEMKRIQRVEILRLGRNFGHQRAIAIGLSYLVNEQLASRIVIMDGDGEDDPQDIPRLLGELGDQSSPRIVFAGRMRRSETLLFRMGYHGFRLLHWFLTGRSVRVGNFSALNRAAARQLALSSDLWNHYAATAFRLRIPIRVMHTNRGHRLAGQSHMNLVSLVTHGLSAISVFREAVCTRLLIATSFCLVLLFCGLLMALAIRFGTELAIPGWTTTAVGLLSAMVLQILTLVAVIAFSLLGDRATASILPLRDTDIFIESHQLLASGSAMNSSDISEPIQPAANEP